MTVTLHFHGAAGTVTGSCYRVVHPAGQFLVDCGLFQGNKSVRDLNLKPTPFDPKSVDFLLLTHAHIDHAGLLPKLYAEGWRGPMWMTEPTAGLLEYLLPDGAGIQESEAERETRKRSRRGEEPAKPLYTMADAEEALQHRRTCAYGAWIEPGPGVRARYWNAGHIIGSASIEVEVIDSDGKPVRLMFSGDIGPDEKVFYNEPEGPSGFDYILCESTYGGRDRADYTLVERREALKLEIQEAMRRGGNLVIPAFAVERSQELLHDIGVLIRNGEIDPKLVVLDSPLASKVTSVYRKYASMFEDTELAADELFNDPRFRIIEAVEDSKALNAIKGGAIILSASGMADAGRIKHHLRNNLIRSNATVLFVGYQAPGTLGQIILSGAKEVRIHGTLVPVRATVRSMGNYSAHADHSELMDWIAERLPAHGALFLTHGEDEERHALRDALVAAGQLGGDQVILPQLDDYFELDTAGIKAAKAPPARRVDPAQMPSDWHNAFSDFTIRLSQRLHDLPDSDKLALMLDLQARLSDLGAAPSPKGRPTPVTPVETQAFDE
ncbi:MBL fold metallo-hydrolase RNA specificity domain-containing protein [Devosia sediminis]|uniref:MBL fold metallo-hydrolase n=1 Tax=Devosia sediminis TaxID=2798801 RepID=A0A934IS70_9HYPH|nr:MBL fold metallo-hydrolase [Devosia sediminis]MBJ3785813.1 MBL fold metallo-hydrolase [Devosia sediminis]